MGDRTFRLDDYELQPDEVATSSAFEQALRHRKAERFLRGPVPWNWIVQAARLKGSALLVGLILWHKAGMTHSRKVSFCLSHVAETGLGPQAARRGLRALQTAGLVAILRKPGRGLEVALLDTPANDAEPKKP
jgi:hypothetical protein